MRKKSSPVLEAAARAPAYSARPGRSGDRRPGPVAAGRRRTGQPLDVRLEGWRAPALSIVMDPRDPGTLLASTPGRHLQDRRWRPRAGLIEPVGPHRRGTRSPSTRRTLSASSPERRSGSSTAPTAAASLLAAAGPPAQLSRPFRSIPFSPRRCTPLPATSSRAPTRVSLGCRPSTVSMTDRIAIAAPRQPAPRDPLRRIGRGHVVLPAARRRLQDKTTRPPAGR